MGEGEVVCKREKEQREGGKPRKPRASVIIFVIYRAPCMLSYINIYIYMSIRVHRSPFHMNSGDKASPSTPVCFTNI